MSTATVSRSRLPSRPDDAEAPENATLRERKKQRTRRLLHSVALDLVLARGLAGVTVDEICAEAAVSTRTFFNYFPSKAAAAVGLTPPTVRGDVLAAFHEGRGDTDLVPDLCRVVAETVDLTPDRSRLKTLLLERPELVTTVHAWMSDFREQMLSAVAERAGTESAHLATALVLSAFSVVVHGPHIDSRDELAERLVETVGSMAVLAGR